MPKRFLAVLVTLPLLAGVTHISLARAQSAGPCVLVRADGETIRHLSKRRIRCAVSTFGPVPGGADRAICIAKRESGLIPTATSATGKYLGLFQHSAATWPSRYVTWTDPTWQLSDSALNGRTNSVVTIQMVHAAGKWGPTWPADGC